LHNWVKDLFTERMIGVGPSRRFLAKAPRSAVSIGVTRLWAPVSQQQPGQAAAFEKMLANRVAIRRPIKVALGRGEKDRRQDRHVAHHLLGISIDCSFPSALH
jgi:hypothetical protein